jgi:hypothetical protein
MEFISIEFFYHVKRDKHYRNNSNRKAGDVDQKQSGIIFNIP